MKRLLDLCGAAIIGILSMPILLVASIAIRVESKGTPVFAQQRLGKHEIPFTCYKLRTMRMGTPSAASHLVGTEGITHVGAVLRSLKIDELPQMVNVLKGDMSLVGPRPGLPNDDALTAARRRHHVFDIRPGITGLAQTNNVDMSAPENLALIDREYIDSRTLGGDVRLLIRTMTGTGRGDAARKEQGA